MLHHVADREIDREADKNHPDNHIDKEKAGEWNDREAAIGAEESFGEGLGSFAFLICLV